MDLINRATVHGTSGSIVWRWALLVLVSLIAGAGVPQSWAVTVPKNVLLLHSYHPGLAWTDNVHRGFMTAVRDEGVTIFVEYLDTKRHSSIAYLDRMARVLAAKYKAVPVDAVVVSDDNAFRFALRHRAALFDDASVVFCGVNDLSAYFESTEFQAMMANTTGVVEAYDLDQTLTTALALHPDAGQVVVINDTTTTGQLNNRHVRAAEERFRDRVAFVYFQDMTMAELESALAGLPTDTIVLLMSFNRDRAGATFTYRQSAARIVAASPAPIYGVWRFYLDHGIVGGMLTDGVTQGQTAADLLIRTLSAGSADAIPVITQSPNNFMFDFSRMTQFGLTKRQLPPGSHLINLPTSFFFKYRWAILFISAVLAVQLAIIVVLTLNVLRRRRAEAALTAQKEAYRLIFDSIQDAYYEADLGGRVLEVSPSIEEVLGYSREMFLGSSFYDIYEDPADRDRFLSDLQSSGHAPDYELRLKHRDGHTVHCAVNARLLKGCNADPAKIVGSMRNIEIRKQSQEEQKRLAERLHRAQKMEAVGTLAGGVAHDLNNILSGVTTYPELLLMKMAADDPLRQSMGAIQSAGLRAVAIVQDLLTLARRSVIPKTTLQCNGVISDYLASPEFARLKTTHPSVHVDVQLDPHLAVVDGSAHHLTHVVLNVIVNAVEAIVDGGQVRVQTGGQQFDTDFAGYERIPAGEYAVITVADTGAGIAPADLEKIFEPFYTTKKMGKSGTGLGMAVVWGIVHDHDGFVDIVSQSGQGTALSVYLPVATVFAEVDARA